mmetsp:Transcript_22076/g.43440  ORF Transcript_22076/g.43440 Transcript_22076/m.43440 type:complete len:91 (-) Transcript_22076:2336-2608(-)
MVDKRWAMTIVVRATLVVLVVPSVRLLSAACTERSVTLSKADVASSSTTRGGSLSKQRAMETRCFSPPESLRPRSPTIVSKPSGRLKINS